MRGDVRGFSLGQRFDVVTCMFDSLNYLTAKRDLARAFRNVRRHLHAGGCFAFDMNTFDGLRDRWCRTSAVRERGRVLIIESSFDERWARGRAVLTGFVRDGRLYRRFEEQHIERGYRPDEIDDLLARSGFAFKRYDGDTLGRPRKRSARLVYVCRTE